MPDKENNQNEKKQTPEKNNVMKEYKTVEKPEPTGYVMLTERLLKKDEKKK